MFAELIRHMMIDNSGIFGELLFDNSRFCLTKELLWKYNQPNISCIPDGTYQCCLISHKEWGNVVWILNIKNRSGIYFHYGSYLEDTEGCILTGNTILQQNGESELLLTNTKPTHERLIKYFLENKIYKFSLGISSPWGLYT